MKKLKNASRRNFIKQSALASPAFFFSGPQMVQSMCLPENSTPKKLKVFLFSKVLQFLDYQGMSEAAKEMGFDGLDLTVRPKGHVLPENVVEDLQKATAVMQSFDLLPQLFSTNVSDAQDPIHRKVLETASQLGYQYYRTAWFKYKKDKGILETVTFARKKMEGLAALNEKLKIQGGYQNHSGHYFGSSIWDLHRVLEKLNTNHLGSQYDIMHATVEGGKNWEMGFKLIQPYINTIVLKDFVWAKKKGKWSVQYVPLGEGMVNFKRFFALLKKQAIDVPISIHVEYDLGGAEHGKNPSMNAKKILKKIKKDLDFVRQNWKAID